MNSVTNCFNAPILEHFGSGTNMVKLTYESIIKFIDDNKDFINAPTKNNSSVVQEETNTANEELEKNNEEVEDTEFILLEPGTSLKISKFGSNLKTIFDNENLVRVGVINEINKKNVSFYTSMLSLMHQTFGGKNLREQNDYITRIIGAISDYYKSKHDTKYRKLNWDKNLPLTDVNNLSMRVFADYFDINIFIINIEDDTITVVGGMGFVSFKKNFFLCQTKTNFEPVYFNDQKFISQSSGILKRISNDNILITDLNFSKNKNLSYVFEKYYEQLDEYLMEKKIELSYKEKMMKSKINYINNKEKAIENLKNGIYDDATEIEKIKLASSNNKFEEKILDDAEVIVVDSSDEVPTEDNNKDDNDTDAPENNEQILEKKLKYSKEELDKMKIVELSKLVKENNISVKNKSKNKTKKELIDDLLLVEES